ncbi:hypothetical protein AM493_08970 [Flavobacterium akiainvivens]|uniref:Lipoprotein n=1 Tax=Flavobacterium akiainvivens TaxID=1202724 RepID=A0A0N0RQN0_9FLAO|nr:hypothetical protein [Flavobacterium akiainvivens]KOS06149.1 hypothetical protein AM493_08970 [Flavobacterium akiainvivens]SFQ67940.1 hypothetical protein SAMN05444144_11428 [Flavobacterium akiainvivens]
MKTPLTLLLLTALMGCKSKTALIDNLTCGGCLEVQADKRGGQASYSGFTLAKDENALIFMGNFNDSIKIEVNGITRFEDFVTTHETDGINNYFKHNYGNNADAVVKITSLTRTICCDFKIGSTKRNT